MLTDNETMELPPLHLASISSDDNLLNIWEVIGDQLREKQSL
jgi:hypothetical protein